mgnify:CR=1 FL=1
MDGPGASRVPRASCHFLSKRARLGSLVQALVEFARAFGPAFVRFREGGRTPAECRQVAYAIAHSPLVKTAFFASDPNLGRILAAVGYAGIADLDQGTIDLYLDDVHVAKQGGRNPFHVLRGLLNASRKNLDGAFLMDLLDAGLAIMELSAGSHDGPLTPSNWPPTSERRTSMRNCAGWRR